MKIEAEAKMGSLFIVMGLGFACYGLFLYFQAPIDTLWGFFLNTLLFVVDCTWMWADGLFLILAGILMIKKPPMPQFLVLICGSVVIFNLVFLMSSLLYNTFATPGFQSNGRIFTYLCQSALELSKPDLSWGAWLTVLDIIILTVSIYLYRQWVTTKWFIFE